MKTINNGTSSDLTSLDPATDYPEYIDLKLYQFKNDTGELMVGTLTYAWDGSITWDDGGSGTVEETEARWMLVVINEDEVISETTIDSFSNLTTRIGDQTETFSVSDTVNLALAPNDEVYIWIESRGASGGAFCGTEISTTSSTVNPDFERMVIPVQTKVFTLQNAVNKIIEDITGSVSNHLGTFLTGGLAQSNYLVYGQSIIDGG